MTSSNQPDDNPASDENGTIRAEFDWSSLTPSTAVIQTVAIASNCKPTALEPLYESVDPAAVDSLIRSGETRSPGGPIYSRPVRRVDVVENTEINSHAVARIQRV